MNYTHYFPSIAGFPAALHEALSRRSLILLTLWMAAWYGLWLFLSTAGRDYGQPTLFLLETAFFPLLAYSVFNYRAGLLLSIVAAPLLVVPPIPHWFTQGFGDLFAHCCVIGFAWRNPSITRWRQLWERGYLWLVFIIAAAVASLVFIPPDINPHITFHLIKYGLAEIAGYILAFSYFIILAGEIRSRQDIMAVFSAIACAVLIITLFNLAALPMVLDCKGGYNSRTTLTCNQGLTSTFGDPNSYTTYLLLLLPPALLYFFNSRAKARQWAFLTVLSLVFFVQTSLSRMGFLGLILITAGWALITMKFSSGKKMRLALLFALPVTYLIWYFPACTCKDAPPTFCPFYRIFYTTNTYRSFDTSAPVLTKRYEENHTFGIEIVNLAAGPKAWENDPRMQLIKNALSLWRLSPVTGVGVGMMQDYSIANQHPNRAHNQLLTILAEQGAIGAFAWIGFIGFLAMRLRRARQNLPQDNPAWMLLALAFCVILLESLFIDFYRFIWLWQFFAILVAVSRMDLSGRVQAS